MHREREREQKVQLLFVLDGAYLENKWFYTFFRAEPHLFALLVFIPTFACFFSLFFPSNHHFISLIFLLYKPCKVQFYFAMLAIPFSLEPVISLCLKAFSFSLLRAATLSCFPFEITEDVHITLNFKFEAPTTEAAKRRFLFHFYLCMLSRNGPCSGVR